MRLIILLLFLITHQIALSQTGNLTVTVTGIKADKGTIEIGIFNSKYAFPKKGREFKTMSLKANAPTLTFTIKGLPDGAYAIALYHDINADGKVNKNIIGVPKEGYGFSNNVKPLFSSPSFEKAKFTIASDTSITISLIH